MNLFQADSEQIASTSDVTVYKKTEESKIRFSKQKESETGENEQRQSLNTKTIQKDQ